MPPKTLKFFKYAPCLFGSFFLVKNSNKKNGNIIMANALLLYYPIVTRP